jgi:hypothetical protein
VIVIFESRHFETEGYKQKTRAIVSQQVGYIQTGQLRHNCRGTNSVVWYLTASFSTRAEYSSWQVAGFKLQNLGAYGCTKLSRRRQAGALTFAVSTEPSHFQQEANKYCKSHNHCVINGLMYVYKYINV